MDLLAEENGWKVTDAQLQTLRQSSNVRCALQDARLRQLIVAVNSASDREAAVDTAQRQHRHFAKFLGETLKFFW